MRGPCASLFPGLDKALHRGHVRASQGQIGPVKTSTGPAKGLKKATFFMPQIKLTLNQAVLDFWDARLAATGLSRSQWLNMLILTWSDNNRDPLVVKISDNGREAVRSNGGSLIPRAEAAVARREVNRAAFALPELRENERAAKAAMEALRPAAQAREISQEEWRAAVRVWQAACEAVRKAEQGI